MKTMRYFALALIATAALFSSCEKTDDTKEQEQEQTTPIAFALGANRLDFDFNGGSQELAVSAPGKWSIAAEDSWCTVSPASGEGSGKVTVTVPALADEEESRSTALVMSYNGFALSAAVGQTCNPDYFTISTTRIELNYGACDFAITVLSRTRAYEITIVDSWITEVSRSGKPETGETIVFHAEDNLGSEEPRSGVISVCTLDGSCIPVMVEQAGCVLGNVLAMRFTATWCGWCPYMDETFHKVEELSPLFRYVTFHASNGYPLYFKACEPLVSAYKIQGFPTGILAGWKEISNNTNTDSNAQTVLKYMEDFQSKFPSQAKISGSASVSGNTLTVKADITRKTDGDYKVTAILMESGIVQAQAYYYTSGGSTTKNDFVHDNIARLLLNSDIMGDALTSETVSWTAELDSSWNKENLSVLVYVLKDYADLSGYKVKKSFPDYYITNAEVLPVSL